MPKSTSPIRDTDEAAIALAQKLLATANFAALGFSEPDTSMPMVSRVGINASPDPQHNGAPVMLISDLANHTKALEHAPACSMLIGEPGKGDPLAHPRITLIGRAEKISHEDPAHAENRQTYLIAHPKAALYVDFADFSFWQFMIERAHLYGGFGKAYILSPENFRRDAPDTTA